MVVQVNEKMKKLVLVLSIGIMVLLSAALTAEKPGTEKETGKQENQEEYRGKMTLINAGQEKKYTGELGNFYFKDADLRNVLINFARTYKLNMVIDPDVSGKVTCHLTQVPWDQALAVILSMNGMAMVCEGNIISIVDLFKKKK